MGADSVRDDFLNGLNGAPKLTDEDLKTLDNLYNEVEVKRQTEAGEAPFAVILQKAAEHFVSIVDGKQKEFIGTTYLKIKELVTTINSSGYFDQTREAEVPAQQVNIKMIQIFTILFCSRVRKLLFQCKISGTAEMTLQTFLK